MRTERIQTLLLDAEEAKRIATACRYYSAAIELEGDPDDQKHQRAFDLAQEAEELADRLSETLSWLADDLDITQ